MVIVCQSCSRRFNLDETRLKPGGSKVRCSKCGAIFTVCPFTGESDRESFIEVAGQAGDEGQAENSRSREEKRMHPRLPVSVPMICDALDLEGNPNDLHIGSIKEVSSAGITLELFTTPVSQQVNLSFIDVQNRDVQIGARVVHSRIDESFKTRVGLSLTGSSTDMENFVAQVMRTNQLSCGAGRQSYLNPRKSIVPSSD